MLIIEQHDSISQIDGEQWDRLAGTSVPSSHGWLRTVEESVLVPGTSRYVIAYDYGRLIGAAIAHVEAPAEPMVSMDDRLYGRYVSIARALRLTVLPTLCVGGGRLGFSEPVLLDPGISRKRRCEILRVFIESLERLAGQKNWTICYRTVGNHLNDLARLLRERRYLRTEELPVSYIEPVWTDFGGYLKHLKGTYRNAAKSIRREINVGRRHGIVLHKLDDLAADATRVHQLIDAHFIRHNGRRFPFKRSFFAKLGRYLEGRAEVWGAELGGNFVAVQLRLLGPDTLWLSSIGLDPLLSKSTLTYFNLCYNAPMHYAIEHGIARVNFGTLTYQTKIRRGCSLAYSDLYLRGRNRWHHLASRPLIALRTPHIRRLSTT